MSATRVRILVDFLAFGENQSGCIFSKLPFSALLDVRSSQTQSRNFELIDIVLTSRGRSLESCPSVVEVLAELPIFKSSSILSNRRVKYRCDHS